MQALRPLIGFILFYTLAVAAARAQPHVVVMCHSPMFQQLLRMPVRVPQQDLAVPLHVIDRMDVEGYGGPGCLPRESGMTYEGLLFDYVESAWIDEVTGVPQEWTVATVMDAIHAAAQRRTKESVRPDAEQRFFAKRRLAYQRSFRVTATDPAAVAAAWSQEFPLTAVNVSNWPIRWRAGIGAAPQIWFRTAPESVPLNFICTLVGVERDFAVVMKPAQPFEVSCHQEAAPEARDRAAPAASAIAAAGNWALHSLIGRSAFSSMKEIDVDLSTHDARLRSEQIIATSTCTDRGSCSRERQIASKGRSSSAIPLIALAGFVAGAVLFTIAHFLAPSVSGKRIAKGLSLFLVLGAALIGAIVFTKIGSTQDPFVMWGVGLIGFGAIFATLPAIVGLWVACAFFGRSAPPESRSEKT